jgi:hypothetical protein
MVYSETGPGEHEFEGTSERFRKGSTPRIIGKEIILTDPFF